MAKRLYTLLVLFFLCALAFGLRMYRIDQSPKGALIDEAHFGYLAQSILETGKDEHGTPYPIIFRGFGDNKLPAGVYLLVPFVKFLGLSNTTIRIPSIIAGTLLVVVFYWLLRLLGFEKRYSYIGSGLVAILPWPFFLSRFGFESNLGLFFFTTGMALLIQAEKLKSKLKWGALILASAALALTWYSYVPYRPVTLAMLVGYWLVKLLFSASKEKKSVLLPAITSIASLVLLVLPLLIGSAAASNSTRLNQVGIFSDPSTALLVNENRTFCSEFAPKFWCYGVWNKVSVVVPILGSRYLHSFAPQFLATQGEAENVFLTIQGFGQIYMLLYPFFVIGLAGLAVALLYSVQNMKFRFDTLFKNKNGWWLIGLGLVLAPIPTALVGIPQPVRISPFLPFVIILIVLGIRICSEVIKNKWLFLIIVSLTGLVTAYQAVSFFTNYYFVHTIKHEYFYQSYLPELNMYLSTVDQETEMYLKPFYSDPLMFFAYYANMSPATYQKEAVLGDLELSGFQHTVSLGNIHTSSDSPEYLGCRAMANQKKALYVTNEKLPLPELYKVKSSSGVHTFAYVYDITHQTIPFNCP